MKVIFSTGVGRLHFAELVQGIIKQRVECKWLLGWAPQKIPDWLSNLLSKFTGRSNFAKRITIRRINAPNGTIIQEPLGEFLWTTSDRVLSLFPKGYFLKPYSSAFSWWIVGWQSKKHLQGDIFHVRSGAGQAGAIACAKRRGMKVVVDHSIAHPREIAAVLDPLAERTRANLAAYSTSPFWKMITRDCEAADLIVVNSDYVADTFEKWGTPREKIWVHYWGVRKDFVGLKKIYTIGSKIKLLFTGAFGLRKGAEVILEALKMLKNRGMKFELFILGAADEGKQLYEELGYDLPIKFVGAVLQDKLLDYFDQSDIYLFPSYIEGCARSAMEALGAGLPVIATHSSGIPFRNPPLYKQVPAGDPESLANGIEFLASDESVRRVYGQRGVEFVKKNCDWDIFSKRLIEQYEKLLEAS